MKRETLQATSESAQHFLAWRKKKAWEARRTVKQGRQAVAKSNAWEGYWSCSWMGSRVWQCYTMEWFNTSTSRDESEVIQESKLLPGREEVRAGFSLFNFWRTTFFLLHATILQKKVLDRERSSVSIAWPAMGQDWIETNKIIGHWGTTSHSTAKKKSLSKASSTEWPQRSPPSF